MTDDLPNLTPQASRAARAILQWTVRDLGAKAGLRGEAISAFENGRPMRDSNKRRVVEVFAEHGVEVLNGDAPGARIAFVEAYANPNSDGVLGVVVRWRVGDPIQWMTAASALDRAELIPDERISEALRTAAIEALAKQT